MPNWCENDVSITGEKSDMELFLTQYCEQDPSEPTRYRFLYEKIAPVVLPIALGFTGLGPIFGPMVGSGIASLIQGKSLGKSLKSALISGAVAGLGTGLAGGFQGLKPGGVGFGEGFTSSIGNALSSPGVRS